MTSTMIQAWNAETERGLNTNWETLQDARQKLNHQFLHANMARSDIDQIKILDLTARDKKFVPSVWDLCMCEYMYVRVLYNILWV